MRKKEKSSPGHRLSRRDLLLQMTGLGLCGVFDHAQIFPLSAAQAPHPGSQPPAAQTPLLSPSDDEFLEELEKRNFQFFWEQASPESGLVKDRCNVLTKDASVVGSIAATGFGLTALCIGQQRGYVPLAEARDRVLLTLRFLWKKMASACGTLKFLLSTPPSCFAESSHAGGTSANTLKSACWRSRSLTVSIGLGFPKTPRFCPTAGRLNSAFSPIAGTTTAK